MEYRAFGAFRKGYAHVKNGSGVEDYAGSYNDPDRRFHIGVICDGHSDKNCFRSGKGAQYGCESAIEILKRFFELYLSQEPEARILPDGFEIRLKKSLKLCWDRKVYNDIKENPLNEEDFVPLTDRVRKIYESGNGLLNIYGATFLAIGICEDFFIALHIGDGVILCIDEDGKYYSPVPQDAKSETGAPASLCDTDLFSRENAFRVGISKKLPQIATVSSDGIQDCMDDFDYKRFTCSLFKKMEFEEEEGQLLHELNEKQMKYFTSCLEYYADKGHGAEDDCSLAAIYDLARPVPEVRISSEEAIKLWERALQERNEIVRDYEKRKSMLLENMAQVYCCSSFKGGTGVDQWMEAHEKYEDQKRILKTIVTNENEKVVSCEKQLVLYSQYIEGFSEENSTSKKLQIQQIDESLMVTDDEFLKLKTLRQDYQKKMATYRQLKSDLGDIAGPIDDGYDDAKEAYEKAFQEYEAAKHLYEMSKNKYFENRTKTSLDFRFSNRPVSPSTDRQPVFPTNDAFNMSGGGYDETNVGKADASRSGGSAPMDRNKERADRQRTSETKDKGQKSRRFKKPDFPWF